MEHLDTALKVWQCRGEEFPKALVEREETGCCGSLPAEGPHTPPE